ncbi:MAG: RNA polymerase sigma factor [Holophagales bacterium]|nr:RNA polymerase sigma factor [Holophagales bacterium]
MRNRSQILDELLVIRCQAGDAGAFDLLAARWHPKLLRLAGRVAADRDAAPDIVQEAWVAIVRGLGRLRDPAHFPGWACRIVSNKSRDWIGHRSRQRERARQLDAEAEEEAESRAAKEQAPARSPEVELLRECLRRMEPQERALLSFFYLEGFSVREIAEVLTIPEGTVKSRLFHARRNLRQTLDGA